LRAARRRFGPLRSVCHKHNVVGNFAYRGYSLDVDAGTGFPINERHPFCRGAVE
jgi:hypothetical protein